MSPYLGPACSAHQRFQVSFKGGGGGEVGEGGDEVGTVDENPIGFKSTL